MFIGERKIEIPEAFNDIPRITGKRHSDQDNIYED